eukprot:151010_1
MSVAKVLLALFVVVFNNTNASLDWVEVTSPLLPLAKSGSCIGYYSLTDSIWILGGHPGATNKVEYNRGTNNFIEHTDFSRSLKCYGQSSIQIDDTIYIFIDSGGSEYIATFNIASNTFIPEAIQKFYPNLRHFPCVTNIGTSYLLVLGGRSQYVPYTNYNDFSIYDLTMNQWINNGPPLTIPRNSFSCNVMNNMLYIIGGTICSSTADSCSELNSVEMINVSDINTINQQSWIILSDTLHSKKSSMRSVAYNDKIYVLGGITDSSQLSEVDLIDTNTNSITLDSNLIMAVDDTAAVVAGNTIYAFGGNTPTDTDRWQYSYLTENPTIYPSSNPTVNPTINPTVNPTILPSNNPTVYPTINPTLYPTVEPTVYPSNSPTINTANPTHNPTNAPIKSGQVEVETTETTEISDEYLVNDLKESGYNNDLMIYISIAAVIFLCCLCVGIIMFLKKKNMETQETSLRKYIPSNTHVVKETEMVPNSNTIECNEDLDEIINENSNINKIIVKGNDDETENILYFVNNVTIGGDNYNEDGHVIDNEMDEDVLNDVNRVVITPAGNDKNVSDDEIDYIYNNEHNESNDEEVVTDVNLVGITLGVNDENEIDHEISDGMNGTHKHDMVLIADITVT